MAAVGRADTRFPRARRSAARRELAGGRPAGPLEPAPRRGPLRDHRRRRAALHDVPGCLRGRRRRAVEPGRGGHGARRRDRRDPLGARLRVGRAGLRPGGRPARDAAARGRPALHRRDEQGAARLRRRDRRRRLVAQLRDRLRGPAAADPLDDQGGLRRQPPAVRGHDHRAGRRPRAGGHGTRPGGRERRLAQRELPGVRGAAGPHHLRRRAAAGRLRRPGGARARPAHGRDPLGARARRRQRLQLPDPALER